MKDDIHNYKKQLDRIMFRILHPEEVIKEENKRKGKFVNFQKENRTIASEWKDYLISEGIGMAKIGRYMTDLIKFEELIGKPFPQANEKDLRKIIAEIESGDLAPESKKCFKVMMRKLYRFIRGVTKRGVYPPEVDWISINIPKNQRRLPEQLFSADDVKSMVKHCRNRRDRAFVSSLLESGARIGEIATMQIKHVNFERHGARLNIKKGKTGARSILIVWSAPYLRDWINAHPDNENPEAYLYSSSQGLPLSYSRFSELLKDSAKRAGINKRVYCHLARHSQATKMASYMPNAIMEAYFGWVPGSKMSGTYVHLNGKDTDKSVLKANGVQVNEEEFSNPLKKIECIRCKELNTITDKFCYKCGLVLNEKDALKIIQQETERKTADEMMNSLMKDPDILELIKKKLST